MPASAVRRELSSRLREVHELLAEAALGDENYTRLLKMTVDLEQAITGLPVVPAAERRQRTTSGVQQSQRDDDVAVRRAAKR
jgi:hypothetical protein